MFGSNKLALLISFAIVSQSYNLSRAHKSSVTLHLLGEERQKRKGRGLRDEGGGKNRKGGEFTTDGPGWERDEEGEILKEVKVHFTRSMPHTLIPELSPSVCILLIRGKFPSFPILPSKFCLSSAVDEGFLALINRHAVAPEVLAVVEGEGLSLADGPLGAQEKMQ